MVESHLDYANRFVRDRRYFVALLEIALKEADASSIRDWLEVIIARLGPRGVRRLLDGHREKYPRAVQLALYHMMGSREWGSVLPAPLK